MHKLCSSQSLLAAATRASKAVAALNFYNAETLIAHLRAAEASNESIILQTTEATINYLGLRMIVGMANAAATDIRQGPLAGYGRARCHCPLFAMCLRIALSRVPGQVR